MRQKDGSDWMALLIIVLVFACLLGALMAIGHGNHRRPFTGKG